MHLVTSFVNGRVLHTAYPLQCGQPPESPGHLFPRDDRYMRDSRSTRTRNSAPWVTWQYQRKTRSASAPIVDGTPDHCHVYRCMASVVRVCCHACGVRALF